MEGLVVRDVKTGKVVNVMRSVDPIRRICWRPDGRAISYFRQEPGSNRRRLFVWELDRDEQRELRIPTSFAQATVRWSPDGKRIAFTSDRGILTIVNSIDGTVSTYGEKVRAFDWSSDSSRIAAIQDAQPFPRVVLLLNAADGGIAETVTTSVSGELKEVAWQRSANLLVVSSDDPKTEAHGESRYALNSIDRRTQCCEVLFSGLLGVRNPLWLPGEGGCLWDGLAADKQRRMFVSVKGVSEPRPIPLDGLLSWRCFLPDGKGMIVLQESSAVNRLARVSLDGGGLTSVIAANQPASISAVEHKRIEVRTSTGDCIAIQVSTVTDVRRRANAAFIRLHGGQVEWGGERWAETQLYLEYGVDVIQVAFRGLDHGANDLIAALDYARSVLGVPSERIVALGASTPAASVVHAAQLHPEKIGIVGIIGLYKEPQLPRPLTTASLHVFGFHGERDRTVAPEIARNLLEMAFGEDALRPPRGLWHVFQGEDHALTRDESFAKIHATILRQLGLIENVR